MCIHVFVVDVNTHHKVNIAMEKANSGCYLVSDCECRSCLRFDVLGNLSFNLVKGIVVGVGIRIFCNRLVIDKDLNLNWVKDRYDRHQNQKSVGVSAEGMKMIERQRMVRARTCGTRALVFMQERLRYNDFVLQ